MWDAGGEVFSTPPTERDLRDDPEDPARRMIRGMLALVAQYERDMIVLRLRRGRRRKHDKGGYVFGRPPYGWMAEGKELVPVEAEQVTIARAVELAGGGASLRAIAAALEAEGHRPRPGSYARGGAERARSGHWQPTMVARVLARAGIVSRG